MAGEVGVAYVALMPSMDSFNKAVEAALSKDGATFDKAGTSAGGSFIGAFSSRVGSIGGNALTSVVGGFTSLGTKAGEQIVTGIRSAYSSVGSMMQGVGAAQVTSAGRALGINLGNGITSGLSTMRLALGSVVGSMINGAIGSVTSSVGTAISRLDTIRNFPRVMGNLGITEAASAESIQRLSDSIDGLPTSLDSLVSFTQKIVPMFSGDMDKATQSAIAFNNAIVAGGRDVVLQSNAMEQWSQMMAAGKVDMAAWRSVVNAMPAQMQQVAQAMGKANAQDLYDSLVGSKNGTIPLTELNEAFIRLSNEGLAGYASFAEQAQTATAGIGTAMTNVRNRIAKSMASVLDWVGQENISGFINGISSQFAPAAGKLTTMLDGINFKGWAVDVGSTLSRRFGALAEVASPLRTALAPLVSNALPAALALVDGILGSVTTRATQFFDVTGSFVGRLTDRLPQVSSLVSGIADAFVNMKLATWETALGMWEKVFDAIAPVLPQIIGATTKVTQTVGTFVGNMAGTLVPIVTNVFTQVADLIALAEPFIERIVTALAPVFQVIAGQITGISAKLLPIFAGLAEQSAPMLVDMFTKIGDTVARIIDLLAPHLPVFVEAIGKTVETFLPAVERLFTFIEPHLDTIAGLLPQLLGLTGAFKLVGALGGGNLLGGILGNLDLTAIPGLFDKVGTLLRTGFSKTFSGLVSTAVSSATAGLPSVITDAAMGLANAFGAIASLPTGAIVAGIAGIAASLVWCWNTSEEFRDQITGAISTIGGAIGGFIEKVSPVVSEFFETTAPLLETVATLVGGAFSTAFAVAADVVSTAFGVIGGAIEIVAGVFKVFFGLVQGIFTGDWSLLFDGAGLVVRGFVNTVSSFFGDLWQTIKDVFGGIIDFFVSGFSGLADFVGSLFTGGNAIQVSDVPSVRPFGGGGIVTQPTRALIGEAGIPEAVVPLSAQAISQFLSGVSPKYQQAGAAPKVEVNIDKFVNNDTARDVRSLSDEIGRDTIRQLKMLGVGA